MFALLDSILSFVYGILPVEQLSDTIADFVAFASNTICSSSLADVSSLLIFLLFCYWSFRFIALLFSYVIGKMWEVFHD